MSGCRGAGAAVFDCRFDFIRCEEWQLRARRTRCLLRANSIRTANASVQDQEPEKLTPQYTIGPRRSIMMIGLYLFTFSRK